MNARQTHAVVAAGLRNPALLDEWLANPSALDALGVSPGTLDLATLRKFAGLTTLVRHNALRGDLPRTFRLLSDARLEIELFADYAAHLARNAWRLAPSPTSRASDLADFLARWTDQRIAVHRRLHDLIRHESALTMVAAADLSSLQPPASEAAAPESIPSIAGTLVLHAFATDPRGSSLEEREPVRLGYWRADANAAPHIVELDALGFELLGAVDGCRSADGLSQILLRRPAPRAFLAALDTLATLGVIRIVKP